MNDENNFLWSNLTTMNTIKLHFFKCLDDIATLKLMLNISLIYNGLNTFLK